MPPQIVAVDESLDRILKEKFTSTYRTGYINVNGVCMPEYYAEFADRIENMEVRDDDVWVCSFPKSGSTWTQVMVWYIANGLNFEETKAVLPEKFPFLDHSLLFDFRTIVPRTNIDLPDLILDSVQYVEDMPSPRFIKTHLPFDLLPRQIRTGEKKPKVIYVARNVKDTCVSYFHHCKLLEGYRGDFDEFCALFLAGKLSYAPFWKHVLGYWNKKEKDNFLFIKYEEMIADLRPIVKKTAEFLNKNLKSNVVQSIYDHLGYESLVANQTIDYEEVIELNKKYKLIQNDEELSQLEQISLQGKMNDDLNMQFDRWTEEATCGTELVL